MAGPIEQDVILDADGKSIFTAMEYLQREIGRIQKAVRDIGKDSYKSAEDFGKVLSARTRELQSALNQMRTLNAPGTAMGDYDKALKAARDQSKNFFKQQEQDRKESIRRQVEAEREGERIIANQNRETARRETEALKLRTAARLEATRADIRANAEAIRSENQLNDARAKNVENLRKYRTAARGETDPEQLRALQTLIQLEKERGAALEASARRMEQANARMAGASNRSQRLLVNGEVRDAAAASSPKNVLLGYQFEQELARQQLLKAVGQDQIATAQRNLELANMRVAAAERLVRAEQRVLDAETRSTKGDITEQHRTRLALAQQYAREQISQFGGAEAVKRAKEATLAAEIKLIEAERAGTAELQRQAREQLNLAQARQKATENQERENRSPIQNILSPGYAAAAFARTSVYGAAAAAAYGAFNTVQGAGQNVVELEDEFAKLQAISNSTDEQMQKLKGSIYGIGDSSRYAVNDLVKISQTLAQAGVSAAEMTKVLNSVTTLATASGSTPDEAVNLVTSALGAFQLQASEAGRIADLMTSALNRTKLTVQQVGQAIQYVGATAYEQNISLETLLATIGAVAQGGVRSGSTIGTGFRQFLVDLQTPSQKLTFQLERLGIAQEDVNIKSRGLAAVLETLKQKGFGATQAYDGLETRAAAFYLVAKNNTDIMEELQLSFAQQGAAAIANERAMNSLTAQWQRFKNILQEGLSESMEGTMNTLRDMIRSISDYILQMRDAAQKLKTQQAENEAKNGTGLAGFAADPMNYDIGKNVLQPVLKGGINWSSNFLNSYMPGLGGDQARANIANNRMYTEGLGTAIDNLGKSAKSTSASFEVYATTIKDAGEEVDKHATAIVEVDKEMSRLHAQQKDLINNTTRSQAETVTLTARFGGLVKYLGVTKNAYLDLIQAMGQYRGEESRFLALAYDGQVAAQQKQNNLDRGTLGSTISRIKNNSQLMSMLTTTERSSLNNPNDVNFAARMAAAAERVAKSNSDLGNVLNDAAIVASRLAVGSRAAARGQEMAGQARAGGTALGVQAADIQADFQTRVEALGTMDQAARTRVGNALTTDINTRIAQYRSRLPQSSGDLNKFISGMISSLTGMLEQVKAAVKPTQDEIKEAKRKKQEADREERELAKRPKITQSDVDKVGQALGLALGSGVRTKAEQNRLHAQGVTPATGDTSSHSNGGVARDFSVRGLSDAEAERKAATMRAQYKQQGIDAYVKYERGGRNDGTGRHIHVSVRPGTRFTKDRTGETEDQYDASLDQSQIELEQQNLRTQLKDVARATSQDTFEAAVKNARTALNQVNAAIRESALSELASRGVDEKSTQGRARLAQVQQQIEQNIADFDQKISDAILKSIDRQLKAADRAFQRSTQSARNAAAFADARVAGLGYQSNANRVPDYITAGAQRAAAMAKENADRATLAGLPARIAAQESAIASTESNPLLDTDLKRQKVEELTAALEQLKQQRDALSAAFSAGGLVPTTIGEGLTKAATEYQQAHDLTKSFKDTVIMNLGGAINEVHTGLTTMFSDIFSGSKSALGAFGDFAIGVGKYMTQLAAQFVANQALSAIFSLIGVAMPGVTGSASTGSSGGFGGGSTTWVYDGGLIGYPNSPYSGKVKQHYLGGGRVTNGSDAQDSVDAKLAKGEWVVNKRAVDSVGNQFMARLNAHGASAVSAQQSMPPLNFAPKQDMKVYVVAPDQQPSMTPNDVLVTFANDVLSGGETRKLIKHVQNEG